MNNKPQNNNLVLNKIFFNLAVLSYLLKAFFGDLAFLLVGSFLGCLLLLIGLLRKEYPPFFSYSIPVIFIFGSFFSIVNNTFSSWALFIGLTLGSYGVSWEMYKRGISIKLTYILFYMSCIFFIIFYYLNNFSPDGILAYSRNHISVYFINLLTLLFISYGVIYNNKIYKWKYLIPAGFTFVICILSLGVSGILSSFILLFILIFLSFSKIIIFIFLYLLIIFSFFYIDYSIIFSNNFLDYDIVSFILNTKMFTDIRYNIWSDYFDSLNTIRLLSGTSFSEEYAGYQNIHNSYLLLHQRIGFFSFFIFFIFSFSLYKLSFINKFLFACLFSIFLRAFSDTIFFAASPFDFIIFYLVLFCSHRKILRN